MMETIYDDNEKNNIDTKSRWHCCADWEMHFRRLRSNARFQIGWEFWKASSINSVCCLPRPMSRHNQTRPRLRISIEKPGSCSKTLWPRKFSWTRGSVGTGNAGR